MRFNYFIKLNGMWVETDGENWANFKGQKKIKSGFITQYFEDNKEVRCCNIAALLSCFRY